MVGMMFYGWLYYCIRIWLVEWLWLLNYCYNFNYIYISVDIVLGWFIKRIEGEGFGDWEGSGGKQIWWRRLGPGFVVPSVDVFFWDGLHKKRIGSEKSGGKNA